MIAIGCWVWTVIDAERMCPHGVPLKMFSDKIGVHGGSSQLLEDLLGDSARMFASSVCCTHCLNWKDCIISSISDVLIHLKRAAYSSSSGSAKRMYRTRRRSIQLAPKGKGL